MSTANVLPHSAFDLLPLGANGVSFGHGDRMPRQATATKLTAIAASFGACFLATPDGGYCFAALHEIAALYEDLSGEVLTACANAGLLAVSYAA